MIRKIIAYLYICVFLFVPVILSAETSEMFEIPKMLFIYTFGFAIMALYFLDFVKNSRNIKLNKLHIIALLFLASQILSWFFSIDRHTSIFGYYGRFNGGLFSTVIFGIYFFVASQIFSEKTFKLLFKFSIIASLLVLLWGLPGRFIKIDSACVYFRSDFSNDCWTNEFRPAERMFSTLGQPNWLGTYFAAHVFVGIYIFLAEYGEQKDRKIMNLQEKMVSYLPLIYALIMLFGVLLTGSRSSLISIVLPLGIEAMYYLYKRLKRFIFIILLLILLGGVFAYAGQYVSKNILKSSSSITHSGTIRLIVWEGAFKLWAKYPVFGTGAETFAYAYYQTRPEAHNNTSEKDFVYNKAHNEFLNILATSGALGFVTYSSLIIYSLYSLFNSKIFDKRIIAYGILSIAISNFFGFSTSTSQLLLYILFSYSVMSDKGYSLSLNFLRIRYIAVSFYIFISLFFIYTQIYMYKYLMADMTYALATSTYESGNPAKAVTLCINAYETKFEHIYADKCASMAASTALLLKDSESEELNIYKDSFVKLANSLGRIALVTSPKNPIYIRNRIRVLDILMKVESGNNNYKVEKSGLISKYRKLAPTDNIVF